MNNQMTPKISVIIPCYNQGQYLDETVDSVLNQTFQDFEIIIVNDGSTDEYTNTILTRYDKPKTTVITTKNHGLAAARNKGFEVSRGQFIQFLDADDLVDPRKFESQLSVFMQHSDIVICYTNYQMFDSDSKKLLGQYLPPILGSHPFEDFLFLWERKLSIPIHCGLFKRQAWEDGLPFITGFKAKEDWVMWITLAKKGYTFYFIDEDYALYRQHSQNMCKSYTYMLFWFMKAAEYIRKNLIGPEYVTHFDYEIERYIEESLKNFDQNFQQQARYLQERDQILAQFFLDTGLGFNETQSITKQIQGQERTIEFDLSEYADICYLRFDPANALAAIHLVSIELLGMEGERYPITTYQTNACHQNGSNFIFDTNDPIITFASPAVQLQKVLITLEYVALGNAAYPYIYHKQAQQIQQQAQQIQQQAQQHDEVIRRYEEKLSREIHSKTQLIQIQDDMIQTMENTFSWKITKPLRVIRNYPAIKQWADWIFTMFRGRNRP